MSTSTALIILATLAIAVLLYVVGRWAYRASERADEAILDAATAQNLAESNRDRLDRSAAGVVAARRPRSLRLVKEHRG